VCVVHLVGVLPPSFRSYFVVVVVIFTTLDS